MAEANQSYAFMGNGKVYLTPVKDGIAGKTFWVGVASAAAFNNTVENDSDLKEYHSGKNQTWDSYGGDTSTTMTITLSERRPKMLAAALQATAVEITADTVTAEEHEFDEVGDIIFLKNKNASAVVVTDGSGSPMSPGSDYSIDANYGTIEILNVDTITSPISVSYEYGTATVMKPLTNDIDYYRVRIDGLNKVGQKDKQVVTAYRADFSPADTYDLINDDYATMDIEASLSYDEVEEATYEIVKL